MAKKISKKFLDAMGVFPADMVRYLPLSTQEVFRENFEQVNGGYLLPQKEVVGLLAEAKASKMSQEALRNDPHGRGFHGGDPELGSSLTPLEPEIKGREFRGPSDLYGSKPKVFRSVLPYTEEEASPLFYGKYGSKGIGFTDSKNQYKPITPKDDRFFGAYDANYDELLLMGQKGQMESKYPGVFKNRAAETEAHEYIHRYGTNVPNLMNLLKSLGANVTAPKKLRKLATELFFGYKGPKYQHKYIDEAFRGLDPATQVEVFLGNFLKTKEAKDIMEGMDNFAKNQYIQQKRNEMYQQLGLN